MKRWLCEEVRPNDGGTATIVGKIHTGNGDPVQAFGYGIFGYEIVENEEFGIHVTALADCVAVVPGDVFVTHTAEEIAKAGE